MVWLTGGMFAIAFSMIFALLGLILCKGLATHWQRSYTIYPLVNGEFEAGELQYRQSFNISQQSLGQLDANSQAKAEEFLAGRHQADSTQLYLRTGNYDVTNRHFAFLPSISINIETEEMLADKSFKPTDLWLLERREWGVLYGFPCRCEQTFAPELDAEFAALEIFMERLVELLPLVNASTDMDPIMDLGKESAAMLEGVRSNLKVNWEKSLVGGKASNDSIHTTSEASLIRVAVEGSHRNQLKLIDRIEAAKQRLGRLDRQLSMLRLGVRKAEIRDGSDLQSIADEAAEIATAKAILDAVQMELKNSIQGWKRRLSAQPNRGKELDRVETAANSRYEVELKPLSASLSELQERLHSKPSASKRAIEAWIGGVESVTRSQYGLNLEIARLEAGLQKEVLTMDVPALDWLGEVPLTVSVDALVGNSFPLKSSFANVGDELWKLLGLEDPSTSSKLSCVQTQLSQTQSLISLAVPEGIKRFWLVDDFDKRVTRVAALREKSVLVSDIVRFVEPNQLGFGGKLRLYVARWIEFLFGQPREGGIEGGFFPALWGTIVMTLIMSMAVMPFGVIAALYMREYAKSGWVLSVIRISINNLAGVPSIVYGVFGLSFFCYTIGGYIDGGPIKAGFTPWPSSLWFVVLATTAMAGTGAFFLTTLAWGSPAQMSPIRKRIASFGGLLWLLCLFGLICLIAKSPYFNGFYQASLPNPTFGKGCLLWASCTLALLTLPVVIVATEEALAAVPNSIREGSYACGAGKWQTLQRIVLPYARPGIITGFILAMARGAGEVAPLMLVGAIPLVTELPLDFEFPFFHGSRSFMHLGFQIYSLGFQSQNSEAAKPMVFSATLLLLTIVTLLNATAIWLRARLRKRFLGSQF